jgi:hypothetical protein
MNFGRGLVPARIVFFDGFIAGHNGTHFQSIYQLHAGAEPSGTL